jgi:hypothetical protein
MDVLFWLIVWFCTLTILDCGIIEMSLKGLWQGGVYRRDAMRWFQIHLFGALAVIFPLWAWSVDGFDVAWKVLAWGAVWLYGGVEDVGYYLIKGFYDKRKWYREEYDPKQWVNVLGIKFPRELPWLGLHTGKWAWTTNWLLYGVSKLIFRNPNISVWALLTVSTTTYFITVVLLGF